MRLPVLRSALVVTALALSAGCAVPGLSGGVGGGSLLLDALAVTRVDAETGNASHKVHLRWAATPNARSYDVVRKFGDQPGSVKASLQTPNWEDETMAGDQSATYTVRAMSGTSTVLTTSDEKAIKVLKSEIGKPSNLKPAENATIGVGETPTLSWDAVEGATWYYVAVVRADNNTRVYGALTRNLSAKLGEPSPLQFDKFSDLFPVGGEAAVAMGVVHKWSVSAIRATGGDEPNKATAIDVTPSGVQRFSAGG